MRSQNRSRKRRAATMTLAALVAGKVDELLLTDGTDDGISARVCLDCDAVWIDLEKTVCENCGSHRQIQSSLRSEFINRALAQGGQVQVVEPIPSLEGVGGIAAALRYR